MNAASEVLGLEKHRIPGQEQQLVNCGGDSAKLDRSGVYLLAIQPVGTQHVLGSRTGPKAAAKRIGRDAANHRTIIEVDREVDADSTRRMRFKEGRFVQRHVDRKYRHA
jgi:hypothetical protein